MSTPNRSATCLLMTSQTSFHTNETIQSHDINKQTYNKRKTYTDRFMLLLIVRWNLGMDSMSIPRQCRCILNTEKLPERYGGSFHVFKLDVAVRVGGICMLHICLCNADNAPRETLHYARKQDAVRNTVAFQFHTAGDDNTLK